jgi:flagellar basal body-associated protein FliL
MAQEAPPQEASAPAPAKKLNKLIAIGVPLFVVQVVVIYVLITRFLAPGTPPAASSAVAEHEAASSAVEDPAQRIFVVKDLIVNPAGTNGTRFLLTTIGFEVTSPQAKQELEVKEVQLRDVLNTILTSKGMDDLVDVQRREDLRREISKQVGDLLRQGTLANVYFSKFIIQ